jgi:hypothetical protein
VGVFRPRLKNLSGFALYLLTFPRTNQFKLTLEASGMKQKLQAQGSTSANKWLGSSLSCIRFLVSAWRGGGGITKEG